MPDQSHHVSGLLWHYTDANGLHGILKSDTLWGTHARFLNDIREILHGHESFQKILKRTFSWNAISDAVKNKELWRPERSGAARFISTSALTLGVRLAVEYINDDILTDGAAPFVTCLSEARDDLSQWRGYGGDGGYAIGFDRKSLEESVKPKSREDSIPSQVGRSFDLVPLHTSRLKKMQYGSIDEEAVFQDIKNTISELIAQLEERENSSDRDPEQIRSILIDRILTTLTEWKDGAFKEEREHRIITFEYPSMFHPKTSVGLIPRVGIEFDTESVKEILVGPGGDRELRKFSVNYFVKHNSRYSHVKVSESNVPFRAL